MLPAVVCGLLLSIPMLSYTGTMLEAANGVQIDSTPTGNAILLAISLGIIIPILSSIVPIREALKQTLSVALDIQRSKSQAVKIEVDVEGKGFPWGTVSFALITSIFGVSIYYLLPLALLSFNLALLIAIFFYILIGLLVGFILLALNTQYLVEKFVVFVFFFWTHIHCSKRKKDNSAFCLRIGQSHTKHIILKNLAGHRLKNRRTAIMYALSIAFVIFVWTSMSLQITQSEYSTLQKEGSYLTVKQTKPTGSPVPIKPLEKLMQTKLKEHVRSWSWKTQQLKNILSEAGYEDTYITHLGRIYHYEPYIVGVSPNYFQNTFSEYFKVFEEDQNHGLDLA